MAMAKLIGSNSVYPPLDLQLHHLVIYNLPKPTEAANSPQALPNLA